MAVHSIKQLKTKFDQQKPWHYRSNKAKTTQSLTYTTTNPNPNHTKPNHNNQTITYHIEPNQTKETNSKIIIISTKPFQSKQKNSNPNRTQVSYKQSTLTPTKPLHPYDAISTNPNPNLTNINQDITDSTKQNLLLTKHTQPLNQILPHQTNPHQPYYNLKQIT